MEQNEERNMRLYRRKRRRLSNGNKRISFHYIENTSIPYQVRKSI